MLKGKIKMNEEYRSIGYKNYAISNMGNIKNEKTGRILKPFLSSGGYYQINLGINKETGVQYLPLIHRLVAEAFVPNPQGLSVVDHIDGNRLNCRADNLRWCTYFQNLNFENTIKGKTQKSQKMKGNQNAKGRRKHNGAKIHYIYIYKN